MNPQQMVEHVESHYQTFWRGDLSDFDTQLTEDFVDGAAPPGTPAGPEPVKGLARMVRAAFPDMAVTVEDAVVGENVVAVLARWRGTHTGPLMGQPASGRAVDVTGMVMWRLNDEGRIDRLWTQMDMAQAFGAPAD